MSELQYSNFQTTNSVPEIIYIEKPLYCCGLGNFVGSFVFNTIDITITILLAVTLPITLPIVMCCEKIHSWKKARVNT